MINILNTRKSGYLHMGIYPYVKMDTLFISKPLWSILNCIILNERYNSGCWIKLNDSYY